MLSNRFSTPSRKRDHSLPIKYAEETEKRSLSNKSSKKSYEKDRFMPKRSKAEYDRDYAML